MQSIEADTTPLNYLVLIQATNILPELYRTVLIPPAVKAELAHATTPAIVRAWICLGPCDLPNVVTISNENGTRWFGEITEFEQYRDLLDWAARSRDAGELLPLPKEFQRHTPHPFRK
jgi:hypothetical protein